MGSDTKSQDLVELVMHNPVVTIEKTATLRAASVALRDSGVGTLVVMQGSDIVGILSERDVVRAVAQGADPDVATAATVLSEEPRYVTVGEGVTGAIDVMLAAGIRHLPVLEEGELIGIVSMRDLVRNLRR